MKQFDIIDYISSLAGNFVIDKSVCERIAQERSVDRVCSIGELNQQQKDLLLADVLFSLYISPGTSASITQKHGNYTKTVGGQTINDKNSIYNIMIALYKKWNDGKLETARAMGGGLQWLDY